MSISAAMSNAVSGLTAASRSGEVVSSNVANATTDGYATRELQTSTRVVGGETAGVAVDCVQRNVDAGLLADRRLADAELSLEEGKEGFYIALDDLVGSPEDDASISGQVRSFETALTTAASRPDSDARLSDVLDSAKGLAASISAASDGVQAERLAADQAIANQIADLNQGLENLADLNAEISRLNGAGRDVTGLEEQRQRVIDGISEIVPVKEVPRADSKVALYTTGGAILFDETPKNFDFTSVNQITADMTRASGALSGITLDGRPMEAQGPYAPLGGGSLEAAFSVRDDLGPDAQSQFDALARDLIERFEDPALDPTLAPGSAGLFTDGGTPLDVTDTVDLAGRLTVNASVDPAAGGEVTRLRDGLGSAAPGEVGNASLLYASLDALTTIRTPSDTSVTSTAGSFGSLVSSFDARLAQDLSDAEQEVGFATSRQSSLRELELTQGVDTDQELQKLLLIEQAYAANAQVIETLDRLIQELIAI